MDARRNPENLASIISVISRVVDESKAVESKVDTQFSADLTVQ